MYDLGLIGYGSMGSMLLNGFLSKEVLTQGRAIVSTRTKSKLDPLKKRWPGVTIADDNAAVARQSKVLLAAVKPKDLKPLFDEIGGACA